MEAEPAQNPEVDTQEGTEGEYGVETISLVVVAPNGHKITLQVTLSDTVQDLRNYLYETVETGYITSYHFELEGTAVSDFVELSELVPLGLKDESIIRVIEDPYDERSARVHLRRLRELFSLEPASRRAESPSVFSAITNGVLIPNGGVPDETQPVRLHNFLANVAPNPKGVKQLNYSGWNPPRGNRKLQGDLFYLDVVTLEGESVVVTAWSNGFFVNSSKNGNFDPTPSARPCRAHALVDLLRELSPKFKQTFAKVVNQHFDSHPYELLQVPFPVTSWLKHPESTEYDAAKSEEVLLNSCEVDFFVQGQQRDWNEDLQICRDLPHSTPMERISRERNMFRVHTEFVEAAVKGAVAVIDGCVPPINATDEKKAHMYIYNNIFYSYSVDSRDIYKEYGGDEAAYKSASNDLIGLRLFNKADVDGLYTLATAVINYRGYRIIGQSIIAGLFSSLMQQEDTNSPSIQIVYGSLEGEDINTDPEFHELVSKAAKELYLKPHKVLNKQGEEVTLASHANIKGIRGTDGRKYVLDLVRATPRDYNFADDAHLTAILRPELVESYVKNERDTFLLKHLEEKRAEFEAANKDKEEGAEPKEFLDEKAKEELNAKVEAIRVDANPDLLTQYTVGGTDEEKEADLEVLKKLAAYLKDVVIPAFVDDLSTLRIRVTEGTTITKAMHAQGINLRYLGQITQALEERKAPTFMILALQREMIVRVTKHIFNEHLRSVKDYSLANTIAQLLNAFFGRSTTGNKPFQSGIVAPAATPAPAATTKQTQKKAATPAADATAPHQLLPQDVSEAPLNVTHHSLWKQIRDKVLAKYNYTLPTLIAGEIFSLPALRSICQKVGIQLVAHKYTLADNSFLPSDILGLFPIAKHSTPESRDGLHFFELGKSFMMEGRLDKAYEYLNAALEFFTQVYGPMHPDVGECYANLAKVLSSAGDFQQALVYQQKATIMGERVLGLDTYDTSHYYSTLASLSHRVGKSELAVKYVKRALYLSRMNSGNLNTDEISLCTHLGTLLQELEKGDEALIYIRRSLELCESIYGTGSVQAASANHALALCLSFSGKHKEAITYETKNYEILKAICGEQDLRTMQAKILIGQLTQTAIKNAKEQQSKDPRVNKAFANTLASLADPANLEQVRSALSDLPVQDVLKWISDNSQSLADVQSISSSSGGLAGNKLRPNRAWGQQQQQQTQQKQTQQTQASTTQTTTQTQPKQNEAKKEEKPAPKPSKRGRGGKGKGKGRK
eukprot:TRINITY_DN1513_c2_g1_i1.p1 TRINITY_DN1513_c2_g1~~TRINITY_DN1513_c2_g1_i1.p1  ORF type:complete len:1243 (-),score=410.37 TRINITY_DN1513_c2_g1_i1:1503-5231(-)